MATSPNGIQRPYLLVLMWVVLLVLIGFGLWYVFMNKPSLSTEQIIEHSTAQPSQGNYLTPDQKQAIIEHSTAQPLSKPTLPSKQQQAILEQSSATPDSAPTLPSAQMKAILDASSAR